MSQKHRRDSWYNSYLPSSVGHLRQFDFQGTSTAPLLPLTMGDGSQQSARQPKRNSMLGVSRKVVKATVRRPLRTVGRFVNRARSNSDGVVSREVQDYGAILDEEEEEEEDALVQNFEASEERGVRPGLTRDASGKGLRVASQRNIATLISQQEKVGFQPNPDWAVYSMERVMRQILLVCAAYIIGARRPEFIEYIGRATEYAVTAWGTCVAILILAFVQKHYPALINSDRQRLAYLNQQIGDETAPLLSTQDDQDQISALGEDRDLEAAALAVRTISTDEASVELSDTKCPHPALSHFYAMNAVTGQRIIPNSSRPFHISTEWFEMDMVILIRTPDVDDPSAPTGTSANQKVAEYLRGKQRRFEFQYQLRVKKVPKEGKQIYFSCELEEPIICIACIPKTLDRLKGRIPGRLMTRQSKKST